jgi:hypothetical protein
LICSFKLISKENWYNAIKGEAIEKRVQPPLGVAGFVAINSFGGYKMNHYRLPGIKLYTIRILIYFSLCVILISGCDSNNAPTTDNDEVIEREESATPETEDMNVMTDISIEETLKSVWEKVDASEWGIAFISNTGVTQSFTAEGINNPTDALLSPDGKAGQWVVELYQDKPEPFSDGAREGISYPFQPVVVTSKTASLMPESTIQVPAQLMPLKDEYIEAFPQALELSIENVDINYDRISALSNVIATGECNWVFRFYDVTTQQITALVLVSGDGQTINDIFTGDELAELLN